MVYYIVNPSKQTYIRLNKFGVPDICGKNERQTFDYVKAKNILENLPRSMKKFHFTVKGIPDIEDQIKTDDTKYIENKNYICHESVFDWLERVRNCNDLAKDAKKRKEELIGLLSDVDKELSNCLHYIELEPYKNGCQGYKEYKKTKIILEKRRQIKDELTVVSSILDSNLASIASDRIEKVVNGLNNRRFAIREVENNTVITY